MKMTTKSCSNKRDSPILPDQDLVKKIEKLEQEESRNGHCELIHIGKMPSEPTLKFTSTAINNSTAKYATKECAHWCNRNSDKVNEYKNQTQTSSLININSNNNNNNSDNVNGNQQLGSANFHILRTRTHTKSLSTRISSLKRESKTTRTLSIVMFTFIACWLPFFIQYLLVSKHIHYTLPFGWKNLIYAICVLFCLRCFSFYFPKQAPFCEEVRIPLLEQLITWLGNLFCGNCSPLFLIIELWIFFLNLRKSCNLFSFTMISFWGKKVKFSFFFASFQKISFRYEKSLPT